MWNYYRDEPSNPLSSNFEFFKNKKSITGNVYDGYDDADRVGKNKTEIAVPLKQLNNFWRTLKISLINCEIEMILTWSQNCALADVTERAVWNNNDSPAIVAPTRSEFQTADKKLYLQVASLSTENVKKLLQQLNSGFKRTKKWNKYRSKMIIQNNNNKLNYLTDLIFTKFNRFFFPFERIEKNNVKKD